MKASRAAADCSTKTIMTNKKISMSRIKYVLRCYAAGKGKKSISSLIDLSRNTVKKNIIDQYRVSMRAIPPIYHPPIHNPPQRLQVRCPAVLIVEIVGMLPNIKGEEGAEAAGDGVAGARFLRDHQ